MLIAKLVTLVASRNDHGTIVTYEDQCHPEKVPDVCAPVFVIHGEPAIMRLLAMTKLG